MTDASREATPSRPAECALAAPPYNPAAGDGDPLRRNWTWSALQAICCPVFYLYLGLRVRGLENVPAQGGALFVINHASFLDPLLVGMPLRRPVSYLARDGLFRVPVIGAILRATYVKPINRDGGSTAVIRQTLERLDRGFLCGIFPEGTRSRDGVVREFKPGLLALLRRTPHPIIPVGVAGSHLALGRRSWFLWPRRVAVVYGAPLGEAELAGLHDRAQEGAVVERIRARVIACQQHAEEVRQGRG
jgi:1-acyl-sn-glycerol-3-phosphate acyltransferase